MRWLLWLSLWSCVFLAQAEPVQLVTPLTSTLNSAISQRFTHFIDLNKVDPRLAQSTAVLQDQLGYLWVGTQHGLFRFDGQHSRLFTANPDSANSLSSDWITSLLLDRNGMLWIGTRYGGLNRYNPSTEQFSRIRMPALPDGPRQVEISALYQDSAGDIWVGSFGAGLFRWDVTSAELKAVALPVTGQDADSLYINSISRDSAGFLWLGTGNAPLRNRNVVQGGAIRWHPVSSQKQTFTTQNSVLTVGSVTSIVADPHGTIWLTSYGGGLYWFDSAAGRLQAVTGQPPLLQQSLLTDIEFDSTGAIWLSSYDQGLWHRSAGSSLWQQYRAHSAVPYQLGSNNLTGIWRDKQQSLWLTSPIGVFGLSAQAQTVRHIPAGPETAFMLGHNDVFGISKDQDGFFWLANRDAGIARLTLPGGAVQQVSLPARLAGQQKASSLVRQVSAATDGSVDVGTDTGLLRYLPASNSWQFQPLPAPTDIHIGVLHRDEQGRLWVGSRGNGLFVGENGQFRVVSAPIQPHIQLQTQTISVLASDDQGYLWIGFADKGLARLNKQTGELQHWHAADGSGLRFDGIQLVLQEAGHIWVRSGNIKHRVLMDPAVPNKVIGFKPYLTELDQDKYLLAARQFQLIYRTLVHDQQARQLSEVHGFQNTTWIGSLYIEPDGRLFRGGSKGMDIYHYAELVQPAAPLQVRFTGFSLFNRLLEVSEPHQTVLDKSIGFAEKITLQYQQDMFSLQFSALDLVDPASIEYRYRLHNFDRDWITTDASQKQATYTRLAPGDYEFEVMARLAGNSWAGAVSTRIAIEVLPPWWLTIWFKLTVLSCIFLLIWAVFRYRLRHELLTRRWLEKVVEQRTGELKTQHQALTASYRDLSLLQTLGRQITASLDLKDILLQLKASLQPLMDAHVLAIGVVKPEHQALEFSYWLENDQVMPAYELQLTENSSLAAVCFNDQREVNTGCRQDFLHYLKAIPQPKMGEPMQSVLYLPLTVKGEQVGCLSVQSPQQQAFQPAQIDLLRTLCSTIAIAVANANVVARLQQTRQQLVMQEKMASLGGLVAGVAHEINTPLGICVTAASHLKHELELVAASQQERRLTVQQFSDFLESATTTTEMLVNNTQRAASLVQSFKQVAVDKAAMHIRELELGQYFTDVLQTLQPEISKAHCQVDFQALPGVMLTADAGLLARLLTHLVMNSLQHAFLPSQHERRLTVQLGLQGNQILFQYADNGQGMPAELLSRLFEPFFTTKRHQGFSGLGSHIVYNLVTVELKGNIQVRSEAGKGLSYRILLPLQRKPD